MTEIVNYLNAIKLRLETNGAAFCSDRFNKEFTVQKVFRSKKEIGSEQLPMAFITRPRKAVQSNGRVEHSVYIYAGFWLVDKELALDTFMEFEEMLESAVLTRVDGDIPMAITVSDVENDEGLSHPFYFLVMHLIVKDK
jgi:hypothetical protein